jgi:hypothetical protein
MLTKHIQFNMLSQRDYVWDLAIQSILTIFTTDPSLAGCGSSYISVSNNLYLLIPLLLSEPNVNLVTLIIIFNEIAKFKK